MPYVSKPVIINNNKYLDGGISDSIPIEKIMNMGFDKIIVVLTRPIEYRKKKGNERVPHIYYHKYPKLIETINNRYKKYNEEVEKVIQLEKEKKIFVIRPSRTVDIKRIERNIDKIQEMYDLGKSDINEKMESLLNYLEK